MPPRALIFGGVVGVLLIGACANKTAFRPSEETKVHVPSHASFYDGTKAKQELLSEEGFTSNRLKEDLFADESRPGFFFLESDSTTWRMYYYFFLARKRIFEKLPKDFVPESESQIPVVLNEKVMEFMEYFQTAGRESFSRWLSRSGKYIPMMREILEEKKLPADLVYLAMIESGFNLHARSHRGAVGPWQFIPSTGRRYGLRIDSWVDGRRDPEKSTRAAANYLRDLYDMFASWELAAAGYNAGEDKVQAAIDRYQVNDFWEMSEYTLPEETKDYVPKLFAALIIAKNPKRYGFSGIEYQEPEPYEKVKVPAGKSLKTVARLSGISYERLKGLNPELIKGVTPLDVGGYEVNVPLGYGEYVSRNYEKIRVAKDGEVEVYEGGSWIRHKVKRGETLSHIARKYNTKSSSIARANGIRNPRYIRVGQVIKIPRGYNSGGGYRVAQRIDPIKLKPVKYEVRNGDTLWKIANHFGTSVSNITQANAIENRRLIRVGDVIVVPNTHLNGSKNNASKNSSVTIYKVSKGDTLWRIASKFKVPVAKIKDWNNLTSNKIRPGDKLKIY